MKFRVAQHTRLRDKEIVEVFNDQNILVAVIYPHAQGLHVISKYMAGYAETASVPPGMLIVLDDKVRDAVIVLNDK